MKTIISLFIVLAVAACGSEASSTAGNRLAPGDQEAAAVAATDSSVAASSTEDAASAEDAATSAADASDSSTPDAAEAGSPQSEIIDCSGTVNSDSHGIQNVPWTWKVEDNTACASIGTQGKCEPCNLQPTTDEAQCPVILFSGPYDGKSWTFGYNPVLKVLYIRAVTSHSPANSAVFTPSCN